VRRKNRRADLESCKKKRCRAPGTESKWGHDLGWLGNKLGLSSAKTERAGRERLVPGGGREYS